MEPKLDSSTKLTVLCLEDSPHDVEIMRELLIDAGMNLDMDCTAVESEFVSFLRTRRYDFILSDFKLPGFDAFAALRWTMNICPHVPFICVSGTVGEEIAIELLKQGAVDYILKDRLARLPSATRRALAEAKDREARHRAEEALQMSEEQFRNVFEHSVVGKSITSLDGWIRVNKAFSEMVGYSQEEISGMKWQQLTHPEEIDRDQRIVNSIIVGERDSARWQKRYIHKNGQIVWADLATVVQRDRDGKPLYLISSAVDITERKRVQEALEKNEKRLREAQEMAHLGYWNWDVKTGDVEWSEEVFKIFCLDPKSFTPRIDSILVLSPWPEDHQRDQELIKRAIETHSPGSYEQKFLRPDQSVGHYFSTFQGTYDEKGDLIAIVGTVLDITERKRAEEAVRESEERFSALSNAAFEGIVISDKGQIIDVNEQMAAMLGYERLEVPGMEAEHFVAPVSRDIVLQHLRSGSEEPYEHLALRKDGSIFPVEIRAKSIPYQGRLVRVTAIRDITERRRAEEALRESEERLKSYIEGAGDAIYIIEAVGGRIRNCNHRACVDVGYSKEELLNLSTKDIEAGMEPDQVDAIDRDQTTAEARTIQGVHRRKDGSVFPVEIRLSLLTSTQPKLILAIARDVSERKQSEERVLGQLRELQRWQDVTLEREDRVRQLKQEVNNVLARVGEPIRYPSQAGDEGKERIGE